MGKYVDVSHDGMRASTSYGDEDEGKLFWGDNVLTLHINGVIVRGIYLSFALVDNLASPYYGKHIAYMQDIDRINTGIFCVCEDSYVTFLPSGAYGTNPGLVTRSGDLIYCIDGFHYKFNGNILTIPLTEGTSQGIAYMDTNGQIMWMDNVIGKNSPIYNGYKFVRAYKIGNWIFGQDGTTGPRMIAYEIPLGNVYQVWDKESQVAPRGNDYGQAICAISEPGFFVPQNEFILIKAGEPINPPEEDTFKENIIEKLPMQLNQSEIEYLIQLVRKDM